MLSDESKAKVERLIRFSTGEFNKDRPADFYIYYHPTLYLFNSFESWSIKEKEIQRHNYDVNRKLKSIFHKTKIRLNLGEEPMIISSLSDFDKKSPIISGTFKVGVTNSSAKLSREEREYLKEWKQIIRNSGFKPYKIQFSRNRDHKMHGWTRVKNMKFDLGEQALFVEREILKWARNEMKSKPHLSKNHLPQSGWTETINAAEIDLPTIWAKVKELSKVKK